jgi:hypothetical protein
LKWDSKFLQASQGRFLPHGTAVVPAHDGIDKSSPVPWILTSIQQIEHSLRVEVHCIIEIGSLSSNLQYREQGNRTDTCTFDLCHGTNNRPEKSEKEEKGMRGRGTMRNKILNKYTE